MIVLNDMDDYLAEEAAKEQAKIDQERAALAAMGDEDRREYLAAMRQKYDDLEQMLATCEE